MLSFNVSSLIFNQATVIFSKGSRPDGGSRTPAYRGAESCPEYRRNDRRAKRRVVIARGNFVQGGITDAGVVDTGGDANSGSGSEEKVGRIGRAEFDRQRQRDTYNCMV